MTQLIQPQLLVCSATKAHFEIQTEELEHLRKLSSFFPELQGGELPLPKVHPFEFFRQFVSYVNLFNMYRSTDAITGKPILSRYRPSYGFNVCHPEVFWSDQVDNTQFGCDYDPNRPFFEQWRAIMQRVHLMAFQNIRSEDSDYVNVCVGVKRCYLSFAAFSCTDCLYCYLLHDSTDCIDCINGRNLELCYSLVDSDNCYCSQYCQDCSQCSYCVACLDCIGCRSCIGCVGLRQAEYCVFNQQVSKEQFEQTLNNLQLGSSLARQSLLRKFRDFASANAPSNLRVSNLEDCTGGNYLKNSKDCFDCYFSSELESCGFVVGAKKVKDAWRGFGVNCELEYQSSLMNSRLGYNSLGIENSENCLYTWGAYNHSAHLFGCLMLKNKSYCILNKQYTKESYFALVSKIISDMRKSGEWGGFLPPAISPHSYEETPMDDWLEPIPLSEAQKRGYRLQPLDSSESHPQAVDSNTVPDNIKDVSLSQWSGKAIACKEQGRPFKLQHAELEFYQKHNIPVPRVHWKRRLEELVSLRTRIPAA